MCEARKGSYKERLTGDGNFCRQGGMEPARKTGIIWSVLTIFWICERIIGLVALPDDMRAWLEIVAMIPDPIGWIALGASSALLSNYFWHGFRAKQRARRAATEADPTSISYSIAGAIIDRYISPAMMDKSDAVKLIVRKDILDRFGETPGAKIGQAKYNGKRLQQWVEHNAARFLVDHRGEMR